MYKLFLKITALIVLCYIIPLKAEDALDIKYDSAKVYVTPSVTVTSTKAIFGKTPAPFAELSKSEIKERYITSDMPKLLSTLPSVVFSSQNGNGIGYSSLTMRGFDQRRIAVLVNGIPQNDPEDHQVYWIDMPDLAASTESIQVQRGAGLSNYGSPSIGGSINLTTSNYANYKGVKLFSGFGIQELGANNSIYKANTSKMSIEVSSGLIDNWAFYTKLSKIQSDGYRENSWTNMNSFFLSAVNFHDNFTTQINIFGGPVSDGLAYNGLPKSYISNKSLRLKNYASGWSYDSSGTNVSWAANRSKQETEEFSQPHFEILNDWKIDDNFYFKSSLFYYQGGGYFDGDAAWADDDFNKIASYDYPITNENKLKNTFMRAYVDNKQAGWIPRLIFKTDDNEFTLGAELRIHRSNHYGKVLFAEQMPDNFNYDYKFYSNTGKRDIISLFVKDNYNLDENIMLFADLQLVNHRFAIAEERAGNQFTKYLNQDGNYVGNGDEIFSIHYTFLNPRVGINFKVDENISSFLFLSYISREPRMRNLYAADDAYYGATPKFKTVKINDSTWAYDFNSPIAKPERMIDIEYGINYKAENLILSGTAYFMDYNDELVKTGKVDIWGNPIDENASRSRHYGIELEGKYNFKIDESSKFTVWANTTFSKNKFLDYNISLDDGTVISLKDNKIAGFPDFMVNFGCNYYLDDLFFGITAKYVGEYYTDNYGKMLNENAALKRNMLASWDGWYSDNVVDSYFVVDLDISYEFKDVIGLKGIKFIVQVNNLFNKLYAGSGEGKEFFPAQERYLFLGLQLSI
jgi:iron complex outermembrane recepter protein